LPPLIGALEDIGQPQGAPRVHRKELFLALVAALNEAHRELARWRL
jgi:hypothetical protein